MPLWRWLVIGALFVGAAVYFLVTGQIAIDKARTVFITRGANPLGYWAIIAIFAAVGTAALRQAWKKLSAP